jgi:hypothetical protein
MRSDNPAPAAARATMYYIKRTLSVKPLPEIFGSSGRSVRRVEK